MNVKHGSLYFAGAVCAGLILTGCETSNLQPKADSRPRFYETAQADVILKFSRWDTIHLLRPDSREDGYLPILTRADVERELKTRHLNRELAVVVLGFLFSPVLEAQVAGEWEALLSAQGFKRVVVLRTGASRTTDGLLVIHDSGILGRHDTQPPAPPIAALPSAVGADAADSSGR